MSLVLDSTAEFCRQVGGDESKPSHPYGTCVVHVAFTGDRRHSVKEEDMVCVVCVCVVCVLCVVCV